MAKRSHLLLCIVCCGALGLLVFVANHLYEQAPTSLNPAGEHILLGRPLPPRLGQVLWLTLKPMLLVTLVAAGWSLYRCIKAWREGPPEGLCPVCGYDLRASKDRCPECGTPIPASSESCSHSRSS